MSCFVCSRISFFRFTACMMRTNEFDSKPTQALACSSQPSEHDEQLERNEPPEPGEPGEQPLDDSEREYRVHTNIV